jgi:hypothetical protein
MAGDKQVSLNPVQENLRLGRVRVIGGTVRRPVKPLS